MSSVTPECEQLSIVLEAERRRAVRQEAVVFEPVHHGNGEATDGTVHGYLCSHGDGDVVRTLKDCRSSRDPCKADGHTRQVLTHIIEHIIGV